MFVFISSLVWEYSETKKLKMVFQTFVGEKLQIYLNVENLLFYWFEVIEDRYDNIFYENILWWYLNI